MKKLILMSSIVCLGFTTSAIAGSSKKAMKNEKNQKTTTYNTKSNVQNTDLENIHAGEYITASGKVTSTHANGFKIRMADQQVAVEVNNTISDLDGYQIKKGDQVVVSGKVDKNFLKRKEIVADSIYIKNRKAYFFADSADKQYTQYYIPVIYSNYNDIPDNAYVYLRGIVKDVDKNSFEIFTGERTVHVNVESIGYDPLDDKGMTQVDVGANFLVSGFVDHRFFKESHIDAAYLKQLKPKVY